MAPRRVMSIEEASEEVLMWLKEQMPVDRYVAEVQRRKEKEKERPS